MVDQEDDEDDEGEEEDGQKQMLKKLATRSAGVQLCRCQLWRVQEGRLKVLSNSVYMPGRDQTICRPCLSNITSSNPSCQTAKR